MGLYEDFLIDTSFLELFLIWNFIKRGKNVSCGSVKIATMPFEEASLQKELQSGAHVLLRQNCHKGNLTLCSLGLTVCHSPTSVNCGLA